MDTFTAAIAGMCIGLIVGVGMCAFFALAVVDGLLAFCGSNEWGD